MSSFTQPLKKTAYKILLSQIIIITGLALVLFLAQGIKSGISLLLGGLSYCIPQLAFAARVLGFASPRSAKQFMLRFFLGETFKLLVSACLFILFIKIIPVNLSITFMGYVFAIVSFWFIAPYFIRESL